MTRTFQATEDVVKCRSGTLRYEFRILDKDRGLVYGGSWSWSIDNPFYRDFPEYIDLEKARVREDVWARAWTSTQ